MVDATERITSNPEQCGGRPCIRGMRIRVIDILDLYATGLSASEILDEMPDLEPEDLTAALPQAWTLLQAGEGLVEIRAA